MTTNPEDKALLKIVNHGNQMFYLESASCNLYNEEDMCQPGQPPIGLSNLNENMYLVVRSLKHNNEKIVSLILKLTLLYLGLRNSRKRHFEDRSRKVRCQEDWLCLWFRKHGSWQASATNYWFWERSCRKQCSRQTKWRALGGIRRNLQSNHEDGGAHRLWRIE